MYGFVMSPAREEARCSLYQQHYTLNKVKKVKSQSITTLNLISDIIIITGLLLLQSLYI